MVAASSGAEMGEVLLCAVVDQKSDVGMPLQTTAITAMTNTTIASNGGTWDVS